MLTLHGELALDLNHMPYKHKEARSDFLVHFSPRIKIVMSSFEEEPLVLKRKFERHLDLSWKIVLR